MNDFDFDHVPDRRHSDSVKWHTFDEDVLPLWVADMDFRSPEAVIRALKERVEHGVFGYHYTSNELREVVIERLWRLYRWRVSPEDVGFVPGVVTGLNLAAHALSQPGGSVFIQTPVYGPFLYAAGHAGMQMKQMELTRKTDGRYEIDFDLFRQGIDPNTRMFLMCNPHNPVGKVHSRSDLEQMAEICLQNNTVICSDEIHCDFIYSGYQHIPIASIAPEIAQKTITLMAPSKTFNIAGLEASVAIIPNEALRKQYFAASRGIMGGVNLLGQTAMLAAYRDGQPWLEALIKYLQGNRDFLADFVRNELPGIHMGLPQATFLAWLDCRQAGISGSPQKFFLEKARVALGGGEGFGKGGEGFVRLNFGCTRKLLTEALHRMKQALLDNARTDHDTSESARQT